jgi:hypothetical protein
MGPHLQCILELLQEPLAFTRVNPASQITSFIQHLKTLFHNLNLKCHRSTKTETNASVADQQVTKYFWREGETLQESPRHARIVQTHMLRQFKTLHCKASLRFFQNG